MEETLTVHRLRALDQLRRTLSCTNVIESAFSIVETVCRNMKRWRAGDQIERWVGSGLLVAERQFQQSERQSPDSPPASLDGQCRFQNISERQVCQFQFVSTEGFTPFTLPKLCPNCIYSKDLRLLFERKQNPQIVVNPRSWRQPIETLEMKILLHTQAIDTALVPRRPNSYEAAFGK